MDILSHGLWGGIAFGRKNRKSFWISFLFGIGPDLLSFGLFTPLSLLGLVHGIDWSNGPPPPDAIPSIIHILYDWTHSFVVFAVAFSLVWFLRRRPLYEMLAWPLHILMDIFTHSTKFFPTPFLWPLADVEFNGHPWSSPEIFIPNVALLAILYGWFFIARRRSQNIKTG